MKITNLYLLNASIVSFFIAPAVMAEEAHPEPGQAEIAMRCLICHGDTQTGQQRLAPPMVMVKSRYMQPTEEEFVKVISAWVKKPDADKSKFPGAIHRFNVMPTFVIPEKEVALIAKYIYKTEFKFPGDCGTEHQHGVGGGGGNGAAAGCDESDCPSPQKAAKKTAE